MTSIVSIVTVFMATFVLVFGYMSFSEQEVASIETQMPAASIPGWDR
jgi:hypothetical protein